MNRLMPDTGATAATCQMCGRPGVLLTRHHLIPRTRRGSKSARRRFDRKTMLDQVLLVCRPCHSQIHVVFSEKELERKYHTREALLANERIRQFVRWIRGKPAGFRPQSRKMKHYR